VNKRKKRTASTTKPQAAEDRPATLKDLLGADTIAKLKAQAEDLKAEEVRQAAIKRQQEEEVRQAERKRQENDFAYLLANSSSDWRKFK